MACDDILEESQGITSEKKCGFCSWFMKRTVKGTFPCNGDNFGGTFKGKEQNIMGMNTFNCIYFQLVTLVGGNLRYLGMLVGHNINMKYRK